MNGSELLTLISAIVVTILAIIMLCEYLQLRKDNNQFAKRLGYSENWRKEIKDYKP